MTLASCWLIVFAIIFEIIVMVSVLHMVDRKLLSKSLTLEFETYPFPSVSDILPFVVPVMTSFLAVCIQRFLAFRLGYITGLEQTPSFCLKLCNISVTSLRKIIQA